MAKELEAEPEEDGKDMLEQYQITMVEVSRSARTFNLFQHSKYKIGNKEDGMLTHVRRMHNEMQSNFYKAYKLSRTLQLLTTTGASRVPNHTQISTTWIFVYLILILIFLSIGNSRQNLCRTLHSERKLEKIAMLWRTLKSISGYTGHTYKLIDN